MFMIIIHVFQMEILFSCAWSRLLYFLYQSETLKSINYSSAIPQQYNSNKTAIVPFVRMAVIKRFRTPGPVSVLTQSGSNFLGLDQDDIQVQITGCYKVITQRLILIKGLRYTIAMVKK